MKDVKVFKNADLGNVRVAGTKEQPLFCLKDVCDILEHTNSRKAKEVIENEFDEGVTQSYIGVVTGKKADGTDAIQQVATNFITEPQLYYLLMRSDLPKAKPFRQWVISEVLVQLHSEHKENNKQLQVFNFNNTRLDYGIYNGEPVFNLNSIAEYLEIKNLRQCIDTNDKDYVIKLTNSEVYFTYNRNLNNRGELFLTEAGLYKLIMRSNKPSAETFQKWVVKEVLPSIRKTGSYDSRTPKNMVEALELALEQAKQIQALNNRIEEDKPKVEFFDAVADSKDAISIGEVAKTLNMGIGRNRLFEILRNKSILQADNIPYQKYIDAGYFRVIEQKYTRPDGETHISLKTLVYQKGLNYIRRVVEQEQSKGEI